MDYIKPIKIGRSHETPPSTNVALTSSEMGKLWATYMGNSMAKQIITYFLHHVDDPDIKKALDHAMELIVTFINEIEFIFKQEGIPIPIGFTEKDVNLDAPRLFQDEFYLHYLKYTTKAGMSIYNVAIPLMFREDVKNFFITAMTETIKLLDEINETLLAKGYIIKPPIIPIPSKQEFVKKQSYLNGFVGDVRPLHALEITHLYDNIENNVASKALLIAFSQVVKKEKVKKFFLRGRDITSKSLDTYMQKLHDENLPSPELLDDLVTDSTFSPFSDKIMLFHKIDMFSMKLRAFGNSMAVNGRRDLAMSYTAALTRIGRYVEDGANIMIENDWMEKPPEAADRNFLASK